MTRLSLTVMRAWFAPRGPMSGSGRSRTARRRMTPGAESLEVRDCPSSGAGAPMRERVAHVAAVLHRLDHQGRRLDLIPDAVRLAARKHAAGPVTIYVSPRGKMGARAGRDAAHPLGSITKALKRAKGGGTIVLAPGTYTENVAVSNRSNITIIGAGDQATVLAPSQGDAIRIISSSNVTIANLWLRASGSQGRGLAILGSSVSTQGIRTDGTRTDGVVAAGYNGQATTLTASFSHFDSVQLGIGLFLQGGSSATLNACTFNNNGTDPAVTQMSNGLVVEKDARAEITNSQFVGNTNGGLVGLDSSQVTAKGSTFSSNRKGNGAIFFAQSTANLVGNTFAANGQVIGPTTGLNGLEFFTNFTGTAFVSGNVFQSNTGNGIFVGSAPTTIQIVDNAFHNNFVGMTLDSAVAGTRIDATIQRNTIEVPVGTPDTYVGILAIGPGVTATIGGGDQGNTFANYAYSSQFPNNGTFIYESGSPNLTIEGNTFTSGGSPVSQPEAIHIG